MEGVWGELYGLCVVGAGFGYMRGADGVKKSVCRYLHVQSAGHNPKQMYTLYNLCVYNTLVRVPTGADGV